MKFQPEGGGLFTCPYPLKVQPEECVKVQPEGGEGSARRGSYLHVHIH